MKKIFITMLCVFSLFSFAACGSSVDATNNNNDENKKETAESVTEEKTTVVSTTVEATEKKEEGPDFSKAKRVSITTVMDKDGLDAFSKEFGTKQLTEGEELDFKTLESFNALTSTEKKAMFRNLDGSMSEDYVFKNTFGSGYFRVERVSFDFFLLFVPE